ncbi:hypothetical protein POKO110462_23020 [Pontibacter korlensis]
MVETQEMMVETHQKTAGKRLLALLHLGYGHAYRPSWLEFLVFLKVEGNR